MKLLNGNPFDYNSVSLKRLRDTKESALPPASQLIVNPVANTLAKFLGIDTQTEWNQYYDRVYEIYKWARIKTSSDDVDKIIGVVSDKLNSTPRMNPKRINDLSIAIKLEDPNTKAPVQHAEPVKTKQEEKVKPVEKKEKKKVIKKSEPKKPKEKAPVVETVNPLRQAREYLNSFKYREVSI